MTKEQTWALLLTLGVVEGKSTQNGWNLQKAKLSEADLSEADLSEADLRGADLSQADLHKADLSRANLAGASLREGYLSGANLSGANLHGANLAFAYLAKAILVGADLSQADLHKADLSRADLSRADLSRGNVTDATLTAAVLVKADLTGADLSGACIDYANISGWVIKDITCSHITERKSGKQINIGFGPQEFEQKYTGMRTTAEGVTYASGDTSVTDLQQLIEKYEKRIAELEAQIGALIHKHDILVEASGLLEKEAQAADVSSQ